MARSVSPFGQPTAPPLGVEVATGRVTDASPGPLHPERLARRHDQVDNVRAERFRFTAQNSSHP